MDASAGPTGSKTRHRHMAVARGMAVVALFAPMALGAQPGGPPPEIDVTITAGPAQGSTTASRDAIFEFVSNADASVWCSLDGAPARPCSSPIGYEALATGPHSFAVSVDLTGVGSSSDLRTWTVGSIREGHPPTPDPNADDDGDGVPNAADACEGSVTKLAAVANGCAAVEIAARPERLAAPVRKAFAAWSCRSR